MSDPVPNVTVTVKPNGPLLVMGPITLTDPTGKAVTLAAGKPVALCRCGQSSMKPFCDGGHSRSGFQASDAAPAR
jgi:CDGSH-type Zn-finger protein